MEMLTEELPAKQSTRLLRPLATLLALAACVARVIPHPWNFTPSAAVELFAGARLRSWHAFALPLAARLISDVILLAINGTLSQPALYMTFLPFVYVSIVINVGIGRLLRSTESTLWIGCAALAASVQFFLVTNFGSWIGSEMYPHTWAGLLISYEMGLPFFKPTLMGDLMYTAVLFGAFAWMTRERFVAERVRNDS